jgi:hypothetical protein
VAVRRLTGTKPGRKRPRRTRFRSRRGTKHGGSVFRAHRGYRPGGRVFAAHANRALMARRPKAIRPWKAPKAAAYKAALKKPPAGWVKRKTKAAAYKSAMKKAPASWTRARKKAAKYKAVTPKRV